MKIKIKIKLLYDKIDLRLGGLYEEQVDLHLVYADDIGMFHLRM